MWVFLNNAFLSIVEHKELPDMLMVRARLRGDIQRAFSRVGIHVSETPAGDYRFRATVERELVAETLRRAVLDIDYVNFKNSVPDKPRHDTYLKVWSQMAHAQEMARIEETRPAIVGRGRVSRGPQRVGDGSLEMFLDPAAYPETTGQVVVNSLETAEPVKLVPVTYVPVKPKPDRLGRALKAGAVYVNQRGKKAPRPRSSRR